MKGLKSYFDGFESKMLIQTIIYDAKHSYGRGCGFIDDDGDTNLLHSFDTGSDTGSFILEVTHKEGVSEYNFSNETEVYEFLKCEVFKD